MGLIRAALGAAGGTLADQWKEFFACDALENDILVARGVKHTGSRSSNTKGDDNVISNGSGVVVADGQCMIIVDQGEVIELCAEPGEYTFDTSSEPSIFAGGLDSGLGDRIKAVLSTVGNRFAHGGDSAKDQRVYYFNTKEIGENLYGTATPIPFLVIINEALGYKMSVDIRCNGDYSYRITDPMLFYKNVCGNVSSYYDRSEIDGRLKGELLTALQPALGKLAAQRIEYFEIPAHTLEIADALNEILSKQWREKRGIEIVSFNIRSLSIPDEQRRKLTEWEETAMTTNPNTAAARLVGGQIDAMKTAAGNAGGAAVGFMGMNMAQGAVGTDAQSLFAMSAHQTAAPAADSWRCACGNTATGKFCTECGAKRPETNTADGWVCSCGAVNKGKFCSECGAKKPADAYTYRCDKCGWEPADPAHPPKFCPECGDAFDENDRT